MQKLTIGILGAVSLSILSCAQKSEATADPFAGTWKTDIATVQIDEKPKEYLLQDGVYMCNSCTPPLSLKADGAFHAIEGRKSFDSMSVKAIDDRTVKYVHRLGDRVVGDTTMKVSPDGKLLMMSVIDTTNAGAPPTNARTVEERVGRAPPGAHAVSGSWKTAVNPNMPEEALTFTIQVDGEMINLKAPGQSYSARPDGTEVAVEGDVAGTMVSVERPSPNTLKETYKRNGQVVRVTTMTIGDDGTMAGESKDSLLGSTTKYKARKK